MITKLPLQSSTMKHMKVTKRKHIVVGFPRCVSRQTRTRHPTRCCVLRFAQYVRVWRKRQTSCSIHANSYLAEGQAISHKGTEAQGMSGQRATSNYNTWSPARSLRSLETQREPNLQDKGYCIWPIRGRSRRISRDRFCPHTYCATRPRSSLHRRAVLRACVP